MVAIGSVRHEFSFATEPRRKKQVPRTDTAIAEEVALATDTAIATLDDLFD